MAFWDLNFSLGCSPLGEGVYPPLPSLIFYDAETFGVGQGADPFPGLNPQSVSLPFQLSQMRLDCGQLQQEPAIARLDWLFTPTLRSGGHLHVETLQASTKFYPGFTLPKRRSSSFRSNPSDFWHFHTTLLMNCEFVGFPADSLCKVILATQIHSLARYSKRTVQFLRTVPFYYYQVSGSLNSLLGVLFNFPSRYSFAIGLK